MKLLKVENSLGYFRDDQGNFQPVDKITKEDLLRLVDLTLEEKEIEFDPYDDKTVKQEAHRVIYKSVFQKLHGLRGRREEFVDQSERLYLADYQRYRDEKGK